MKITKLGHSCLMVEMPAPVNRTVIFDPGAWSEIDIDSLEFLDDIVVTHEHQDHMDVGLIRQLQDKFPDVRIKGAGSAISLLVKEGLKVTEDAVEGLELFEAPHEPIEPLGPTPDNTGVHYLGKLTHPGDSLSFGETKEILALPVTAPWGATTTAVNKALNLKPKYVIPVHDALWNDGSRDYMYGLIGNILEEQGITFLKMEYGKAEVIED